MPTSDSAPSPAHLVALTAADALSRSRPPESLDHLRVLRTLGADSWPAIPSLFQLLARSENAAECTAALDILAKLRDADILVVAGLVRYLGTGPSETLALAALKAVAQFPAQLDGDDATAETLVQLALFAKPDDQLREDALYTAALCRTALAPQLPRLIELAQAGFASTRAAAIACIGAAATPDGSLPREALGTLAAAAAHQESVLFTEGFLALSHLGAGAAPVAEAMVRIVKTSSPSDRRVAKALGVIAQTGIAAQHVAPALREIAAENAELREAIGRVLAVIAPAG
jgi:hypothetical protein